MSAAAQVSRAAAVWGEMDKISGVLHTALGGVQSSLRRLDSAAQKIATAPVRGEERTDLADLLVDALVAQRCSRRRRP